MTCLQILVPNIIFQITGDLDIPVGRHILQYNVIVTKVTFDGTTQVALLGQRHQCNDALQPEAWKEFHNVINLPEEVVMASSIDHFKKELDNFKEMGLPMAISHAA